MLDLRFILIIVLIICGNVNLTFGKKKIFVTKVVMYHVKQVDVIIKIVKKQ